MEHHPSSLLTFFLSTFLCIFRCSLSLSLSKMQHLKLYPSALHGYFIQDTKLFDLKSRLTMIGN
ncbi:hypothetical protein AMTRI_Chr11g101540 [Amborella trichopoda]